ncbi:glycoside hydrolase family 5 protein [Wolfiporia cocos MD-104 SS10]|uniref:glucan 1,3-beta-glucosidase n=1 Tax=Wolfiporia cocos (strain MD-104) TaxID=742152 RepID=A0A2H3JP69_WOLCO|nr:glycoside hydrolase family 5 protein [Wolfiporia cocos MD-104 SS10]
MSRRASLADGSRPSGGGDPAQDPFASLDDTPAGTPALADIARPFLTPDNGSDVPLSKPEPESSPFGPDASPARRSRTRRVGLLVAALAIVVIAIVLAIALPVTLVHKHHNSNAKAGSTSGSGSGNGTANSNSTSGTGTGTGNPTSNLATWGGNGSLVTMDDNTTFRYINNFGGFWVSDPVNPFNNSAQAQSYTPPLSEEWDFTTHHIQGVNLGGWLVLEPFITPALYEKYGNVTPSTQIPAGMAVDEWTLSYAMRQDTSPDGGIQQIEQHYQTFITEQDFAQIAGAGLNWIRIPLPFWAIEVWPGEPFLARTAWTYALKAFQWARKYGLRILLDLHTIPGSQNGYNHSGKAGSINFLNGPMGVANAERALDYIRIITEFIAEEGWTDVVTMWGVINEPVVGVIGMDQIRRFYLKTYEMMRDVTGIGKGPAMVIHDGFMGLGAWQGFLPNSDRVVLDTHPYIAFGGNFYHDLSYFPTYACQSFGVNQSQAAFGVTITGEWSAAINDCGLWVTGVGNNPTYTGGCDQWNDYESWNATTKAGIQQFVMAQMDIMHFPGYFFWTWKIGASSATGKIESPFWSYQLGLENGWIPADPRTAIGTCEALGVADSNVFDGTYVSWQTGGAGAGDIPATAVAAYSQYPPPAINNANSADPLSLPRYTPTSAVPTLPPPTFTGATITVGKGWADAQDTALAIVPIQGCDYPDAWGASAAQTAFICNGQQTPAPTGEPYL